MPLSVPVDIPPNNVLKPITLNPKGNATPVPSNSDWITRATTLDMDYRGFVFDNATGLLYEQENVSIEIFNGFTTDLADTLNIDVGNTPDSVASTMTIIGDELFVISGSDQNVIDVHNKSSGSLLRSLNFGEQVFSVAQYAGSLVIALNASINLASVSDGSITKTVSNGDLENGGPLGPVVVNDNLTVPYFDGAGYSVDVYSGFSATFKATVNIQPVLDQFDLAAPDKFMTEAGKGFDGVGRLRLYLLITGGDVTIIDLENEVSVKNFTGTIDSPLEAGKVYYFYITHGTTSQNISVEIDSKTVPVISRSGFDTPQRSIQGVTPMYYDGDRFTVISLTKALAADIYEFTTT